MCNMAHGLVKIHIHTLCMCEKSNNGRWIEKVIIADGSKKVIMADKLKKGNKTYALRAKRQEIKHREREF